MARPIATLALFAAAVTLIGCSTPSGPARTGARAQLGAAPAGAQRTQPLGIISSGPPTDSSFVRLRCLPTTDEGPGTTCSRHD